MRSGWPCSIAARTGSWVRAPVAGDLADQTVKAVVFFDLTGRIIEVGGLVQNIDLPPQCIARLRRQIARGQHAGVALHAEAQIIDIVDIVGGELSDEEAAARTCHQQPLAFEQPSSLTHRRPADAQLPRDTRFHHFRARRQPTLKHGLHQDAGDLPDQISLGEGW